MKYDVDEISLAMLKHLIWSIPHLFIYLLWIVSAKSFPLSLRVRRKTSIWRCTTVRIFLLIFSRSTQCILSGSLFLHSTHFLLLITCTGMTGGALLVYNKVTENHWGVKYRPKTLPAVLNLLTVETTHLMRSLKPSSHQYLAFFHSSPFLTNLN